MIENDRLPTRETVMGNLQLPKNGRIIEAYFVKAGQRLEPDDSNRAATLQLSNDINHETRT
jgi:hypothetical protein